MKGEKSPASGRKWVQQVQALQAQWASLTLEELQGINRGDLFNAQSLTYELIFREIRGKNSIEAQGWCDAVAANE